MNAGCELLVSSMVYTMLAIRFDGRTRFLLQALAALAWLQATRAFATVGIRLVMARETA